MCLFTHNQNRGGAMSKIKICKDCKHCTLVLGGYTGYECWAVLKTNLVTGYRSSAATCDAQRMPSGDCGFTGKLFEPKPYENKWYFLFLK